MTTNIDKACLYCHADQTKVPLIAMEYQDQKLWICPEHLPMLIHSPQKLVGKLPDAEKLNPYEA